MPINEMAAVSVLIPCKGKAPFLLETLESILANSVQPDEIIIVNDSMDTEIISAIYPYLLRTNLRIIDNKGTGLVDALNTGLNYSRNELILRIDADDLMDSNRIQEQLNYMQQNPNTVVLGTQCAFIDKNSRIIGQTKYPTGELNKLWLFKSSCQIAHPSVILRKSAVISAGGYRKIFNCNGMDIAEDFDLWLRMAKFGLIVNLNSALTKYRQHENQISTNYSDAQLLATIFVASNLGKSRKCNIKVNSKIVFEDYQSFLKALKEQHNLVIKFYHTLLLKKIFAQKNKKHLSLLSTRVFSKFLTTVLNLNRISTLFVTKNTKKYLISEDDIRQV